MAISGKFGSILKKTILQERPASLLQSIRCMSSSTYKLVVGDLSHDTDDHSLKDAFSSFARVMRDIDTGRSRGFGYVFFSSNESASSAVSSMDGQKLQGSKIWVSLDIKRPGWPYGGHYGVVSGGGRGADDAN